MTSSSHKKRTGAGKTKKRVTTEKMFENEEKKEGMGGNEKVEMLKPLRMGIPDTITSSSCIVGTFGYETFFLVNSMIGLNL